MQRNARRHHSTSPTAPVCYELLWAHLLIAVQPRHCDSTPPSTSLVEGKRSDWLQGRGAFILKSQHGRDGTESPYLADDCETVTSPVARRTYVRRSKSSVGPRLPHSWSIVRRIYTAQLLMIGFFWSLMDLASGTMPQHVDLFLILVKFSRSVLSQTFSPSRFLDVIVHFLWGGFVPLLTRNVFHIEDSLRVVIYVHQQQ